MTLNHSAPIRPVGLLPPTTGGRNTQIIDSSQRSNTKGIITIKGHALKLCYQYQQQKVPKLLIESTHSGEWMLNLYHQLIITVCHSKFGLYVSYFRNNPKSKMQATKVTVTGRSQSKKTQREMRNKLKKYKPEARGTQQQKTGGATKRHWEQNTRVGRRTGSRN